MRKVAFFIIFFLIIFFLFLWCRRTVFPMVDTLIYSTMKKQVQISTPTTKEECLKSGGEWRRPGPWPKEVCMMINTDGNKRCFAGFQCTGGKCITAVKSLRNPQVFATGYCPKYRILFGCLQEVHFGLTSSYICLD